MDESDQPAKKEPSSSTPPSQNETLAPPTTGNGTSHAGFRVDAHDALTPDPGTEDMYIVKDNKFAFSPGQLSKLFNPKSYDAFYALGGLTGLEKGLRTNRDTGLSLDETTVEPITFEEVAPKGTPKYGANGDDEPTVKPGTNPNDGAPPPVPLKAGDAYIDRRRAFKENRLPEKRSKTLLELAWITYNDKVLILLTVAALISLSLGIYTTVGGEHEPGEARLDWVEGVAIIVAIVIVVVVGTLNDWQMERQFNRLNQKHNDRTVKVVRSGKSAEVSVFDIMVGDVMHINAGDLVPVDGVFITGHGVKCDESSATGESDLLKKTAADEVFAALEEIAKGGKPRSDIEKLDPFIISGSKINEGTGTFLVTAVGVNSSYGRITMAMHTEQGDTPLQKKLNNLADSIAWIGGGAALVLFVVLLIKFLAGLPNNHETPAQKGQEFLQLLITSITVVVVAVPEGLPLAVTLALAFATTRMMKDKNLVRVLKACETMGNATTVCSDKTGTLTQNKMTVVATTLGKFKSFGGTDTPLEQPDESSEKPDKKVLSQVENVPVADFVESIGEATKKLIVQSNAVNSTAFEGDVEGEQTFIGSKTEVALLTLCRDKLGAAPVQEERANANIIQVVPFDSAVKYMATVVKLPNGKFRAYVKGASEILLAQCTRVISDASGEEPEVVDLTSDDQEMFSQTITSYAGQTLRTIGSSYRDFDVWPPAELAGEAELTAAQFNKVHHDMTLVAIFGIKDPLRDSVKGAILDCKRAGVFVRMVTGDNLLTGRAIAKECGIYTPETGGIAMEGPVFRRKSEEELKELVPHLQVLARSSPEDKRILVRTLKELGETVAVTGDGTNDAPALKMADIGFAMGIAGTEVAKEAASIILMDDNFASIVKGISWGRAVNDAVKKFLQFQITVNITAVILTFVSAVSSGKGESVLKAIQLLWVNLIMDTFAALALATDPPTPTILDRPPDRKSAPLITLRMWKMIIGQAICQLAITFTLNFGGSKLLGYDKSNKVEEVQLNSLVFNTFVWLQIFNELNNRRLDNKFNVFEGMLKNWWFIGINVVMVGGQVLIMFVGKDAFAITKDGLTAKEWGLSVGLGAISLPFGAFIRCIPDEWVAACVPDITLPSWMKFWKKTKKSGRTATGDIEGPAGAPKELEDSTSDEDSISPPLRSWTSLRGERARHHIHRGFKEYMHDQKKKVKVKAAVVTGSKTHLPSPDTAAPATAEKTV